MSEFILPDSNVIVDPISESECESLGNNTGLNIDDGETTCQAMTSRLLPLLSQIMGDISSGAMTIYANDDSKCKPDDKAPTLASILSRIYRVCQAMTCVLCEYDPSLSNLLMSGVYPQILMGKPTEDGYPVWVTPDLTPTEDSSRPVTSNGVYNAIRSAAVDSWKVWTEGDNGSFSYFAYDDTSTLPTTSVNDGEYALVFVQDTSENKIYQWEDGAWELKKTVTQAQMSDFTIVHILKGSRYAQNDLYWFRTSWNLLDADFSGITERITALELAAAQAVGTFGQHDRYLVGTANSYADAQQVPTELGATKIVFIKRS